MIKFNKGYNLKIVSVIVSILFLCSMNVYSYADSLRVPIDGKVPKRMQGTINAAQERAARSALSSIHHAPERINIVNFYAPLIKRNPKRHLIELEHNKSINTDVRFYELHSQTQLVFNVVILKNSSETIYALAVSELGADGRFLKTWLVVDDTGNLVQIRNIKHATLPAEYVMDQASYDALAQFTYSFVHIESQINPTGFIFMNEYFDPTQYVYSRKDKPAQAVVTESSKTVPKKNRILYEQL